MLLVDNSVKRLSWPMQHAGDPCCDEAYASDCAVGEIQTCIQKRQAGKLRNFKIVVILGTHTASES
jgi:hypothetical protein